MQFESINPYSGEVIGSYEAQDSAAIKQVLNQAQTAFESWRNSDMKSRAKLMHQAAEVLRKHEADYAQMISSEMGKPIVEARGEVTKCAWVCDYYADNAADFLAPKKISTDATQSFVTSEPIGCVFAIMPWNFPFWQVFRFAAPALMAGNVGLLKHAPNVFGCAQLIERVFNEAGFPPHLFQNLIIHHDYTEEVIANEVVKAVTLTGSGRAGSSVASLAGKYIKKSVLELGGSNSFMVWPDADMEKTVQTAVTARMMNAGQSCIAAKRFIVVEEVYDQFEKALVEEVKKLQAGDPLDEKTEVGPMARKDLADQLHRQMAESVEKGARLLTGGKQDGCYHQPTVLGGVKPGMPAFDEETFGPLACVIKARDIDHAFALSEQSPFGLGVTVCTQDTERALREAHRVSDGAYFVNELVKSDPRLPFGGQKNSGYGRELSQDGIMEFINRKTVYVK